MHMDLQGAQVELETPRRGYGMAKERAKIPPPQTLKDPPQPIENQCTGRKLIDWRVVINITASRC
jgi:hypothetical protein